VGIVAVLVSSLGLFNPRGQPFVFHFEVSVRWNSHDTVWDSVKAFFFWLVKKTMNHTTFL
jgi:hypothetical protein